ncbi:hypothetical protein [Candidatus Methylocalor cossyra]|uniref:Uncharacterized protein n=1 Tax=Candidatus Methylocalor cossyra TaxID=3108543 RepID=A0ABM9NH42_9GAMM
MFRINTDEFLNHPVYTSLFAIDFGLLMFMPLIRPPVLLSLLLVAGLVYLSMYFGAIFASSPPKRSP